MGSLKNQKRVHGGVHKPVHVVAESFFSRGSLICIVTVNFFVESQQLPEIGHSPLANELILVPSSMIPAAPWALCTAEDE